MTQLVINTGNFPDDGTGTPLRTAFTWVNNNFSQIFAAGLVDSNITISNNTIQSDNLNGDIRLWTNGTGVVTVATNFMPDVGCVRNIGSPTNRFKTVYTQSMNAQNIGVTGNLQVLGNLQVSGNLSYTNISNLNISNTSMTLGVGAVGPWAVDGGGLYLDGANASFAYSAADNSWVSNIPTITQGNITTVGGFFIGDGGLLSNVQSIANAELLTSDTLSGNVLYSSLTTVGTLANLQVANYVFASSFIGNGASLTNINANAVTGTVANAAFATFSGAAQSANIAAEAVTAINAETASVALNAVSANTALFAANANCAVNADYAQTAGIANAAVAAGTANIVTNNSQPFITSLGNLTALTVTGGANVGGVYTDNYYYANGVPVSFSGAQYGNANVQAFLSSGNVTTISATGNVVTSAYLVAAGGVNTPAVATTDLTVYGNATLANTVVTGNATVGNILTDGYYYANGVPVTFGGGSSYGNANVTALLASGNVTSNITTTANVAGNYILGNGAFLTGIAPSSNYGNSNVAAYLASGNVTSNIITTANVVGNNLSFTNLYVGNTLFTRTLVVGTRVTPVTIQLASNNSFNVLTRTGNVAVYTS